MTLIYSRPRIRIPKFFIFNSKKSKGNKRAKFIFIILFFTLLIFVLAIRAATPVFNTLCSNKAKSVATVIVNNEANNVIKNYNYSDFIIIHRNNDGKILMLESNMVNINDVISNVAKKIQEAINNTEDENITISIGTFTGINILSGRGYKVPIKISTIGNVKTDVKSEFAQNGINQTLHRLYLEVSCEISILTPFNTISETISNQLILAENVIVGEIPETYYNIEGITESDAMNMME